MNVRELLRSWPVFVPQGILIAGWALVVAIRRPPILPALGVYVVASLILGAASYFVWLGFRRGLFPRAVPIRPRRSAAISDPDSGRAAAREGANERVIEDYIETARSLIQAERFEESADLLRRAIESDPADSRLYNYLGICYSRMSRYDDAVRAYRTAVERDYDHAGAHFNLAVALEHAGQVREAAEQYQRYLKLGAIVGEPEEMLERARERLRFLRGMYPEGPAKHA